MERKAAKRPTVVGSVAVTVLGSDGKEQTRTGRDLDAILRQILYDLRDRRGLKSWAAAARRWGIRQQTISDILNGNSPRLETLSRLCAGLKLSPVDLFREHAEYLPENRAAAPFAEDRIFDSFRAALTAPQARRLLRIIEVLVDRSALEHQLTALESSLGLLAAESQESDATQRTGTTSTGHEK